MKDNLHRIKDGAHIINLANKKKSKETHWVSLSLDRHTTAHSVSFENEYVPQEVLKKIKDKSVTRNIFRIQSDNSMMCSYYCITFIEDMTA